MTLKDKDDGVAYATVEALAKIAEGLYQQARDFDPPIVAKQIVAWENVEKDLASYRLKNAPDPAEFAKSTKTIHDFLVHLKMPKR